MKYQSYDLLSLKIGTRELPITSASVMIVERDGGQHDWELVAYFQTNEPIAHDTHELHMELICGVSDDLSLQTISVNAKALLVRVADTAGVFRGMSALDLSDTK